MQRRLFLQLIESIPENVQIVLCCAEILTALFQDDILSMQQLVKLAGV